MPGMPFGTDSEPADLRNVPRGACAELNEFQGYLWDRRRAALVQQCAFTPFGRSANSPGLISRAFLEGHSIQINVLGPQLRESENESLAGAVVPRRK